MTADAIAIVINGVPRSGKTTLAEEIIARAQGDWVSLGVDSMMGQTPEELLPGMGLRPGADRPDLESFVLESYQRLFDQIADQVRDGRNVVADVCIHDDYTRPLDVLGEMQQRLNGVSLLFVGIRCSLPVLRRRRAATGYLSWERGAPVPEPVVRWQHAVHEDKTYDLELDTSTVRPADSARVVLDHLRAIGRPID